MIYNSPPVTHRSIKVIHLKGRAPWVIFPDELLGSFSSIASSRASPESRGTRRGTASRRSLRSGGTARGRTRRSQRIPVGREPTNIRSEKDLSQFRLGFGAEQNILEIRKVKRTYYLPIVPRHFSPVGAPP